MTKILLQNDRIIFDGHADSVQECETITLLCDSLENNPNFKTVRYESGYAEFEKVGKAEKLMFGIFDCTVVFDANITKVTMTSPKTVEWTTSGQNNSGGGYNDGELAKFTVVLNSGYVIDTITSSDTTATIQNITDSTFEVQPASFSTVYGTITLTSKQGVSSQKSYDLSTSSKWANLAEGNHSVTIKAKASGYRESEASTAVTVAKAGGVMK